MEKTGMTVVRLYRHQLKEGIIATKDSAKGLLSLIRHNRQLLASCSGHNFSIELENTPGVTVDNRWECDRCGGEVDCNEKHWYEQGYQDAMKKYL